ncbi:2-oxo acid dehydrogenase subunit E2 [Acanthopleuribacter pedis]|uniref:Dihydrolipoamide acetyltransferase component of pyruvate dehydrogenase complex n=1 Tax=Acanthopleuribacter pedis TaxID=442870 RepID=A0A8J7U493_9BACT|nr:2-oxo acid dehydrogenase subunit E2 [Acanthopleuribacter pedis]MBO1319183.1 2-oxo acid dehydrogenase subunit E2 [Acanthopleuribacter pedis]
MANAFKLPEIGEGVIEGEIVEWHVKPGDEVHPDAQLVAVLTDKATVEITADFHGVIEQTNGDSGDIVEVGSALLTWREAGAAAPAPAEVAAPQNGAHAQEATAGAVTDFQLPEIGEGVMEGEIVEWHVKPGETVIHDQPIVAVLTDKASVEITAPHDGEIVATVGEPGDVVAVGQVIMTYRVKDGAAVAAPVAVPAAASAPTAVAASRAPVALAGDVDPSNNPSISAFGTPLATPAVRRLAASLSIDLKRVKGTGPNHRITRADVNRVAEAAKSGDQVAAPAAPVPQKAASAPAPVTAPKPVAIPVGEAEHREKIRGLRKAIFNQMAKSKRHIPHFTFVDEVEMDRLIDIRNQLKPVAAEQDIKLTFLPFIVKAVVLALKKFPMMNASIDEEAGELVYKHYYNLGIATATPGGLTVPVLKGCDQKTVLQLAKEMVEVTDRARKQRSTMDDITGGTFTITSLGRLGGLLATPIINHPEVGILGIHNMQERAVVRDGQIVVRNMMNISLSFDHRVIDGDVGATFAQEVKQYLEFPSKLMLAMV